MQLSSSSRYEQLAARLHHRMALSGYERLETPILQPADLFLTRAGDQIIARLFTFEQNGTQIALRPEYTSSAMSRYVREGRTGPARWQFGGFVFEAADDVSRQQHASIGAEAIGLSAGLADAEILALAVHSLEDAGVADVRVHVGHVGFLLALVSRHITDSRLLRLLINHLPTLRQSDGEAVIRAQLDRLVHSGWSDEQPTGESPSPAIMNALLQSLERSQLMGGRTREDIQRRLQRKLTRAEARPQIDVALEMLQHLTRVFGRRSEVVPVLRELATGNMEAQALLDSWDATLSLCEELGVAEERIVWTPALSRNWDYYSGLVFEFHSGPRHVGGGGRYDELARLLGAERPVPAVGFAYYVDEVLDALPSPPPPSAPWTLHAAKVTPALAAWLDALRARDIAVVLNAEAGRLRLNGAGELAVDERRFALVEADLAAAWLEAHS